MNGWMIINKTEWSIILLNLITTAMIEFSVDGDVGSGLLGHEGHVIAGPSSMINKTHQDILIALGLPIHIQNEILEFVQK